MGLTQKQFQVYQYIYSYNKEHGYAPTQREIKEYFGFKSFGSVQRYLKYLTDAGHLELDWNARRGLVTKQDLAPMHTLSLALDTEEKDEAEAFVATIPLLGDVAAGLPSEAIDHYETTVSVPREMLRGNGNYFALKVRGESMIEAGILSGDLAVCREVKTAEQGQIIVAVIEGEATLKYYYRHAKQIELRPANSSFASLFFSAGQEVQILGKLHALWRSY